MTFRNLFLISLSSLSLTACVTPPPVVADYNGDSVTVATLALTSSEPTPEAEAEATRICRAGGKNRAEYASTRVNPNYEAMHLYLCL
jgi:starvation-inducible outer membrane lipoprotein